MLVSILLALSFFGIVYLIFKVSKLVYLMKINQLYNLKICMSEKDLITCLGNRLVKKDNNYMLITTIDDEKERIEFQCKDGIIKNIIMIKL